MQVEGVDFLLTFRCPSICKHCSYKAGPERKGYMKLRDAERYLRELSDTQPLKSITVHGGEPFLYFEHLKRIIEKAKELDVSRRGVITNSYWAKTKTIAIKRLVELKEAGLTRITFSVDRFHQEYIPLRNVGNSIDAAVSVGFEKIWVDSYFLGNPHSDNFYNVLTRKALEGLGTRLQNVEMHTYKANFEGRAAELAQYVEAKTEIPRGRCPLPFWIGGDLKNPNVIEVDFEGNVTLCPGICIGGTKTRSLTQVIQTYDYLEHPILSVIAEEGPIGLLETATAKDFRQHRSFVDECHLCYEIRKFLRPYYPQYLAPATCY